MDLPATTSRASNGESLVSMEVDADQTAKRKEKKRGGIACCVPTCKNNSVKNKNISFHSFPTNELLKEEWIRRIGRRGKKTAFSSWTPNKYSRICGVHFNETGQKAKDDKLPKFKLPREYTIDDDKKFLEAADNSGNLEQQSRKKRNDISLLKQQLKRYAARIDQLEGKVKELSSIILAKTENEEDLSTKLRATERKVAYLEDDLRCREKNEFSIQNIIHNDDKLKFYTGFKSAQRYKIFEKFVINGFQENYDNGVCSGRPSVLDLENKLFLVLCRLRVGLLEQDLAYRFDVSSSTVSKILSFWVPFMAKYLNQIPIWLSKQTVEKYMPENLKSDFGNTRLIMDCTEIFIESAASFNAQSDTYSNYKHHCTAKVLVGIAPHGHISFKSDVVGGRTSDRDLTQNCGVLNLLEEGDSVMVDRGFTIGDLLEERNIALNIPAFLRGKAQLSESETKETRKIARHRIHVERIIRSIKSFRILKYVFPNSMADKLNDYWHVICHLVNIVDEPLLNR